MGVIRDDPYGQFNFLVDLGTGSTAGPQAGFAECSGLSAEVVLFEYRNGNDKENHVRKIPGLTKTSDVTLKRGLIGATDLFDWLKQVSRGDVSVRDVQIQLQNEDHSAPVLTWTLRRARIIKHTSGPLNAKGTDVAIEEIVLSYDRLDMA